MAPELGLVRRGAPGDASRGSRGRRRRRRLAARRVGDGRVEVREHEVAAVREVQPDDLAELGRRVPELVDHGPAHAVLAHGRGVLGRAVVADGRAHLGLEAGLVVVRVAHEDQGLDRHEDLQQRRRLGVPRLAALALPRAQQAQADLAALVEVRVEAHGAPARREHGHARRRRGEARREAHVEDEDARGVGRALGRRDGHAQRVHARRVAAAPRARRQVQGERVAHVDVLLREAPPEGRVRPRRRRRGQPPLRRVVGVVVLERAERGLVRRLGVRARRRGVRARRRVLGPDALRGRRRRRRGALRAAGEAPHGRVDVRDGRGDERHERGGLLVVVRRRRRAREARRRHGRRRRRRAGRARRRRPARLLGRRPLEDAEPVLEHARQAVERLALGPAPRVRRLHGEPRARRRVPVGGVVVDGADEAGGHVRRDRAQQPHRAGVEGRVPRRVHERLVPQVGGEHRHERRRADAGHVAGPAPRVVQRAPDLAERLAQQPVRLALRREVRVDVPRDRRRAVVVAVARAGGPVGPLRAVRAAARARGAAGAGAGAGAGARGSSAPAAGRHGFSRWTAPARARAPATRAASAPRRGGVSVRSPSRISTCSSGA